MTYSGFNKHRCLLRAMTGSYLLAALCVGVPQARAESGSITAIGVGRDSGDAIANLLKSTVARHFKEQPTALVRSILQTEILPNASNFVQSYRIVEGSRAGAVNLSASVDLDVIQGLFMLTPKNLGETEGAKALVLVKGNKLPDSVLDSLKAGARVPDPYAPIAEGGRERFLRRGFVETSLSLDDMQSVGAGEDVSSPELLRGLGAKAGARVVLGISSHMEIFENENSHNKEERVVLNAVMLDVKEGAVIGRASVRVLNPKSRKDQYVADLQRSLLEESKDLFQDVFVSAGRHLVKPEALADFSRIRVDAPPSSALVSEFKALLEAVPGVRSVIDFSVSRGSYEFALRPAMSGPALTKILSGLQSPTLAVAAQKVTGSAGARDAAAMVSLAAKESTPPNNTEVKPNESR